MTVKTGSVGHPGPQQIPQLACLGLHIPAWELVHGHGPSDFHADLGGEVPSLSLRVTDAPPHEPRGLVPSVTTALTARLSVLSTQTDRSWTASNMASCLSQTLPYLTGGLGSSVSFPAEKSLHPLVLLLPHLQRVTLSKSGIGT